MGELIAIGGLQFISLYDLMPGDALMGVGLVPDGEDERVEQGSAREGDEDEVLVELLLLVYAPTDHHSAPEESGRVVLDVQSSSRACPFAALDVENEEFGVKAFTLLSLETDPT